MSCGGNMMRTSLQPLAHLVDAAAEKWLAVEHASEQKQQIVRNEITDVFRIGDKPELTFHGRQYLLSIMRCEAEQPHQSADFLIKVHEIAQNN